MAVTITKKNGPLVLGLDISTKAGVALLDARSGEAVLKTHLLHHPTAAALEAKGKPKVKKDPTAPKPKKKDKAPAEYNQYPRWAKYEADFEALLDANPHIDFAVVEGYGFASQSLSITVEVSTHFKRVLHRRGIRWIEVKPNALKKFVTGKGAGDKNVVMLEAYKRFGINVKDDNECDAACLAFLGLARVTPSLLPHKLPAAHLEPLAALPDPMALPG